MRKSNLSLWVLSGLVLMSLVSVHAATQGMKGELLISAGRSLSAGENLSDTLDKANYSSSIASGEDRSDSFSVGYRFSKNPRWSVDISYLSQSTVDVAIEAAPSGGQSSAQAAKDVAQSLPHYGDGITLVNVRHFPIGGKAKLMLGMGSFIWKNERTATVDGVRYTDSDRGLAPLIQAGLRYPISPRASIELNAQRFFMENVDIDRVSLGVAVSF